MSKESNDCATCAHSDDAPEARQSSERSRADVPFLVCREASPATDAAGGAIWPLVKMTDSCGKWQTEK
jgi:hypothetical protein